MMHRLHISGRQRTRGFSMLELIAVIAIIGILVAVAANRLLPYIDEAERISVLRVEGALRSSLVLEAAQRIVRGRSASIAELEGSNPITLLLEPPKNYLGELSIGESEKVPARHWYFDRHSALLIYQPGFPFAFRAPDTLTDTLAFAVHIEFADQDGSGTFDAARDELHGVRLMRVAGKRWLSGVM